MKTDFQKPSMIEFLKGPHLGFIMDGNRRWAKNHALATLSGHTKGADVMENVVDYCIETEVWVASFWALAKKNIEERSKEELDYLYKLILERIGKLIPKLLEKGVMFRWIGNRSLVPESVRENLEAAERSTAGGKSMIAAIAIGYGWQNEIIEASRAAIRSGIDPETLNESTFLQYLDTGYLPSPDLIVRTGGDTRHSWYFLFASEYSEYFFTNTLWPDFTRDEFDRAVSSLKKARRNFGK